MDKIDFFVGRRVLLSNEQLSVMDPPLDIVDAVFDIHPSIHRDDIVIYSVMGDAWIGGSLCRVLLWS